MVQEKSARKPSEEEARARLAAIVESSDDAIISKTLDGIVTSWNKGAEALYGYSEEEAVGRPISFLVPPDHLDELQRITRSILRRERIERLETVRLRKDGKELRVSLTLSPILAADGSIIGVSTIARDVGERVRMERLLRESEARYRTLVEMAPDAVAVLQDGRFVYCNCAGLGFYGAVSLAQLQRSSLLDLVHPDDREAVEARVRQLLRGEEAPLGEFRGLRLNGEEICVESSAALIDYLGRPSIQVIARDITQRRRAERERESMLKELAFERARFEIVLRRMPIGVLIAEAPSGRLIYHNEESSRIFGELQPVDSLADYDRWKIRRGDGSALPAGQHPLARALGGETVIGEELKIARADGTPGFVSVNAIPIRDASGGIVSGLAAFSDITQSKAAAKALAESEERLNLALDAAEMGSCDMDVATGTGIWSRRHFLLLGYPPPEGGAGRAETGMWQGRIHPEDLEQVVLDLKQARREHTLFRSEHRVVRVDNEQAVWVDVLGRFICDQIGAACRFIGVIFDVTERRAKEEALRRSEQRFRLMSDSMPQIGWTAEPDGSLDYFNALFQAYTGVDREAPEIRAKMSDPDSLIRDLIHPDDARPTMEAWRHAVETGEIYQVEHRLRRFDGAYRWHLSRAIPERDEEGRVVKWYGTATDIDELREVQEKLRASEAKFRWLYESNLIAIFFWNRDGAITEANRAFCDLVGYSEEECREGNLSWLEVTAPEFHATDLAAIEEVMERGICKPYQKEFIHRRDGHRVSVLAAGARMIGTEARGIGFAVDLTELKRAEAALKISEATLKVAVEATGLGIFDLDLRTGKGVWSDIAKRHYGLPPQAEADLASLLAGVHPEDRERVEGIAKDALDPEGPGVYSAEYRTVGLADGKLRWLTMRGRVSFDENGLPVRLVGACLDISEIVKAENALKEEISERLRAVEELRKQEQLLIRQGRLAAMGEMIGNIAHQWRQPLNTLGLIVQELPRYYERDLFSKEYLDASVAKAMQVINYMSKTIDDFRKLFGPDKEKESFRASEVLAKTVSIVEGAFNELKLRIEVSADRDVVMYGHPNEFSQVILNLLMNAKDAILERKVDRPRVTVRLFRDNGRSVLTITDNAGGIDPAIMEKIFDPYFTTKGPDKGTGIGLFMSKTIIEKNMNGTLSVRNTGEGAEFRIEA